jgi:hypothetical protein
VANDLDASTRRAIEAVMCAARKLDQVLAEGRLPADITLELVETAATLREVLSLLESGASAARNTCTRVALRHEADGKAAGVEINVAVTR